MPLITFPTVCYQETCKQRGGDLLIKWDVSHFSPTATCIQLQASVWRLRSVSSKGQMGSSLLIPNLVSLTAAGSLVGAAALQCHRVTSCPWRTLLFSFTKTNDFALHRNQFPAGCSQHCFFQWGVNHALEGPANCSSRVQKQPLGRQLLPLKGYQRVLLTHTPSSWVHPERTSSPKPLLEIILLYPSINKQVMSACYSFLPPGKI